MNFISLFQDYEGVFSLTKRKTKVLTYFSLAGILTTVVLTVVFAFNIDQSKYIPGIIVFGSMFTLNIIMLFQRNYKASLRVIFIMPLALYFFYINPYYSIADTGKALPGLLSFFYFGFIFLMVFGESFILFITYYFESILTLIYFLYTNNLLFIKQIPETESVFFSIHPLIELTIIALLFILIFLYFNNLITKTSNEKLKLDNLINESLKQINIGVMVLTITRDQHGEKSGMKISMTNTCFEKIFKVSKSDIADVEYSEIFPFIFRDSFNWQDIYFHSQKNSLQVYIEHIEKWFFVYNIFPENDLIISCFVNISDLKSEIVKLQNRESRLTNLMGSLPDIFFIIEKDGTYIDYVSNNPELMKLSKKDIIGKTIFEMGFSKPMAYQIFTSIQYVIENDNIETIEYGMELSNGKALMFEMRLAKLNERQVISIGRDITSNKEYQHQLIEARKKTEEASRLKSSFLENISHEIRTPMNAILGFSNMIISNTFSEQDKNRFLDIVIKNGEYLMDVITNIIDISEIESGSITYNPSPFLVNVMFMNIFQKYSNLVKSGNQNINIKLSLGNDSPTFEIVNDNYLTIKIINHLVENAIKFTKEGTIVFGYEMDGKNIKIFARDTGIGIDKKNYETIFEFFRQVDNRISRSYSGTGAGLKIVKGLTEIIGSKIEFESVSGEGSVFYFYIPISH
jgi:PAS domain S-box-containing protein